MKKIFLLLIISSVFLAQGYSQISNSVLSKGDWYKFSIDKTGVFRIDISLLKKMGINTESLDPKNIKIFGNGGSMLPQRNDSFRYDDLQENTIFISGGDDGVFNTDDYILFYAKGAHSWIINPEKGTAKHRQNLYSEKAYYFLTVTEGVGKRISIMPEVSTPSVRNITTFDDYVFYEKEERNLEAVGNQWFGEKFSEQNTQSFKIDFKNAVPNSLISVKVRGASVSSLESSMSVSINSKNLYTIKFYATRGLTLGRAEHKTATINNSDSVIDVSITYNNNGNPSAEGYLDYIEITGKKQLTTDGTQFSFRSFEANNTGVVEYKIKNANNIFQVWDVSNPINPRRINNLSDGSDFIFKADGNSLKEYIVIDNSDFYTPTVNDNSLIKNQNIHALRDINYLIITNNELSNQAKRLAEYHQKNSNLTTEVIQLSEIYNEFGSGSPDITAIRDFIRQVYKTNTSASKKLKYVCFFGDSSYDYKGIKIAKTKNIVPVFEAFESFNHATSYVTDDYFVMLDDDEGTMPLSDRSEANGGVISSSYTIDVASGRIPVTTVQQATEVVDKILSYYHSSSFGDWRNSITLVADDIDARGEQTLQEGMERIADSIKKNKPNFNINKIYADAFKQEVSSGGERYPEVNNAITNAFEKGTLVLDYFGHGGEDGLAAERILESIQIKKFNNIETLPLLITVTCQFSRFDNPKRITAGELTLWNRNGGAVGLITTTREIFIGTGQRFNKRLINILLFNDEDLSIAESLVKAKNGFSSRQKLFIYYLGDPAMKLAIPKPNVRITKMNGIDISQSLDTLKALSKVSFEGVITDDNNKILTDFNGRLYTTVFDKPIDITTLKNDGIGEKMTFDSRKSKLFRGKSDVKNGIFQFDFIVPKDIKIAYGKSKLSFYAENKIIDKSGANFDVVVGGINANADSDAVGPEIKLFMNDESFIDGGNTNASPNIIVLLSDLSGINTSVTSIGHNITAVLDGSQASPIVLNDYYETELNDFTKGKVSYKLRDLSVGRHTIKIKAWDTYNNSSEATLSFSVVSDKGLVLKNVLNYPNPFVSYTEFWFNHNKPNEQLEVQVQIFTVSGKLIKTINETEQTIGNLSRNISWDGLDDFGNKIGKGVYIYKLKVKSTISNLSSEKYEKLVILN